MGQMKTIILAGGYGTRISEETHLVPKPMIEIGGRPLLWHIMRHYDRHGYREFFLALGYKSEVVKRYFLDYRMLSGSLTVNLITGGYDVLEDCSEDWVVRMMDTGLDTNTGGRVRRLAGYLADEPFMLTYGDGVSDVDLHALLRFHREQGKLCTITAVRPPARFGGIVFDGDGVSAFTEKPQIGEGWINGGFMVFEPEVLRYFDSDQTSLEGDVLERLVKDCQLAAFRHSGFWQCMDTLRDKRLLEGLWREGNAPWRTWT